MTPLPACPYCHVVTTPYRPGETRMRICDVCQRTFFLAGGGTNITGTKIVKWLMVGLNVFFGMQLMLMCLGLASSYKPNDKESAAVLIIAPICICLSLGFYTLTMSALGVFYYYLKQQERQAAAKEMAANE